MTSPITLLSGGTVQAALGEIIPAWQADTGVQVSATYLPMAPLTTALAAGRQADAVILSQAAMETAEARGWVIRESRTVVGRVGIGVCVRDGVPVPNIASAAALKAALLAAPSLVYIDPAVGTSGRHVVAMLEGLGIREAVAAKTTLGKGGYVTEPVGRGEIALGIHQISEILPVPGVRLVGPLPEPLQTWTAYVAAITRCAPAAGNARRFLAHLRSAPAVAAFGRAGIDSDENDAG